MIGKPGRTVRGLLIIMALCGGARAQLLQGQPSVAGLGQLGASAPKPPNPNQRARVGLSKQTQQEPLTDRDVIQMVESGKPEAAILATIRSSRTNFDLSPQACRLLAQAHVSRTILNAMGDGSQPPCASTSEPSKPQTPAAVEQCVAACTAQCQKIAGNSARLSICSKDCAQRCQQNGATVSGNISRSTLLAPASPAIQGSSNASNSAGMLATSSTAENQRALGGTGTLPGNRKAGLLGDGSAHAAATVIAPSSGGARVAVNPQPPPRTAANGHAGSPGANVAQASAAVSDYRQPQGVSSKAARPRVTLSAPKQGRKITNPKAKLQDAAIIVVLQKQRQAADAEAAAMKLGIRPAGGQGNLGPSQTMAATAGGRATNKPAPMPIGVPSGSTGSAAHPGVIGTLPPQFSNLAITCSHDPSMRVLTVSGGPTPAIFTPDPKFNFYTITGCSLGTPGSNAKAYIYYQGTFREDFQIQEWNDNWIKLSLDQNISGVDDQTDVTLVIQSNDGKQWTRHGYRFYAARQTVMLTQIPQSDFSLSHFRPDNSLTQSWNPTYTSGSSPSVIPNLSGLSAEVHWDITTDPKGNLVGGSDLYDFSHLHSTFALDSAWMEWKDVSCTDPNYNQFATSGNSWSIDWYGASGVQVSWQGQICKNTPGSCGGAFQGDCFANTPESNYGINVWVAGPRCIDPWTGQKDQNCMNKVQQKLN